MDGWMEIFDGFDEPHTRAGTDDELPSVAAAGALMKGWSRSRKF